MRKQSENPNRLSLWRANRSVGQAVFFVLNDRQIGQIYCQDKGRFWDISFAVSGACPFCLYPSISVQNKVAHGLKRLFFLLTQYLENPYTGNPYTENPAQ